MAARQVIRKTRVARTGVINPRVGCTRPSDALGDPYDAPAPDMSSVMRRSALRRSS